MAVWPRPGFAHIGTALDFRTIEKGYAQIVRFADKSNHVGTVTPFPNLRVRAEKSGHLRYFLPLGQKGKLLRRGAFPHFKPDGAA